MDINFFKKHLTPAKDEMTGELQSVPIKTIKNRYIVFAANVVGYFEAYFIIRSYNGSDLYGLIWYLILPVFMDIAGIVLFNIWSNKSQDREDSYYSSMDYIVKGVLIYSFMYCDCVLIYHDVSEILIFLLIPSVIACFYKDIRWFTVQTAVQVIMFILFLLMRTFEFPLHIDTVPPILRILFFMLGIYQFAHALLGQDRLRLKMIRRGRELKAREELQQSLTGKLDRECLPHIETIERAASDILDSEGNSEIIKYADHILEANRQLKEAISDAGT
ncbi:MAG: hypothetical protein IKP31_01120 [Lachnospiraceae bacterium]|nr:hypothetical protein [Lachnospiraceae bacterium]